MYFQFSHIEITPYIVLVIHMVDIPACVGFMCLQMLLHKSTCAYRMAQACYISFVQQDTLLIMSNNTAEQLQLSSCLHHAAGALHHLLGMEALPLLQQLPWTMVLLSRLPVGALASP